MARFIIYTVCNNIPSVIVGAKSILSYFECEINSGPGCQQLLQYLSVLHNLSLNFQDIANYIIHLKNEKNLLHVVITCCLILSNLLLHSLLVICEKLLHLVNVYVQIQCMHIKACNNNCIQQSGGHSLTCLNKHTGHTCQYVNFRKDILHEQNISCQFLSTISSTI